MHCSGGMIIRFGIQLCLCVDNRVNTIGIARFDDLKDGKDGTILYAVVSSILKYR
ncbi:hypothetical protein [Hoylesella pleuritidis]|nr:hypothetical protein [Hoylesella pleuritidis]